MAKVTSDFFGNGNRLRISYNRYANDGFKYVLKHGIGPGTIPSDVGIIRTQCWDNGLSFIWADRVLSGEELKKFDIPSETELSKYEALCEA